MKVHTQIQRWGNGLALRVSGSMRDIPHFQNGTEVDVEITQEGFTVRKCDAKKQFFPFNEATLIAGLTPALAHADLLAEPLAYEIER